MEKILTEHILKLEECFFGLTIREVRKLVFDVVEKHSLPHSFNKDKKIAGKSGFIHLCVEFHSCHCENRKVPQWLGQKVLIERT